jgi:hypothetical protein
MGWQGWNRIFAVSLCLAAAGGLACLAALYNAFVPRGSVVAFLAATVPLALAIGAVVVGFVWVCEKIEDCLAQRADRRLGGGPADDGRIVANLEFRQKENDRGSITGIAHSDTSKEEVA